MAKRKDASRGPLFDLHGERLDGLENKIDRFIVESQRRGHEEVRIMTGIGSGKVRAAVQAYLKLGGYSFRFEHSASGTNEGVLVVYI